MRFHNIVTTFDTVRMDAERLLSMKPKKNATAFGIPIVVRKDIRRGMVILRGPETSVVYFNGQIMTIPTMPECRCGKSGVTKWWRRVEDTQ